MGKKQEFSHFVVLYGRSAFFTSIWRLVQRNIIGKFDFWKILIFHPDNSSYRKKG